MIDSDWLGAFSGADGSPPTTRQLYRAFVQLGRDFGYDESREGALEFLASFTQRWGKPSVDNLLTIARRYAPGQPRIDPTVEVDGEEGKGHLTADDVALIGPDTTEEMDTTFALATLGRIRPANAPDVLLPYLTSPYANERWLAAFGLVAMRDERVLPAVGRMLLEFIGPDQPANDSGLFTYHFQLLRADLPRVLANWGDPRLAPLLRAALIATVSAEQRELQEPHGPEEEFEWDGYRYTGKEAWGWFYYEQQKWIEEEHRLVYALGRLGAFGALAGIPTRRGVYYYWGSPPTVYHLLDESGEIEVEADPSEYAWMRVPESQADAFRADIWRVHACYGFLEPQFRNQLTWVHFYSEAPEFAQAIEELLERQFGLDAGERHQAMDDYERADFLAGTVAEYEGIVRRATVEADDTDDKYPQIPNP